MIDFRPNVQLPQDEEEEEDETDDEGDDLITPTKPSGLRQEITSDMLALVKEAAEIVAQNKPRKLDTGQGQVRSLSRDLPVRTRPRVLPAIPVASAPGRTSIARVPVKYVQTPSRAPAARVSDFGRRLEYPEKPMRGSSVWPHQSTQESGATPQSREVIKSLPKNLSYDGRSSWDFFELKFTQYASMCGWNNDECLSGLVWCLQSKALDYYTLLVKGQGHMSYRRLVQRLGDRFGEKELPAAIQAKFQQACQTVEESMEEWADRVLTLGSRAFQKLPEEFVTPQVVNKFCQGLMDREAGHHVCMNEPASVQEALQMVRKYQQVHSAMFGKKSRKRDDDQRVSAVEPRAEAPKQLSIEASFEKALRDLEERLTKTFMSRTEMEERLAASGPPRGGKLGKPWSKECYGCGEVGHFRRDCKKRPYPGYTRPYPGAGNDRGSTNR